MLYSMPYSVNAPYRSVLPARFTCPLPLPLITQSVAAQPNTFTLGTAVLLSGKTLSLFCTRTVPSAWICSANASPSARDAGFESDDEFVNRRCHYGNADIECKYDCQYYRTNGNGNDFFRFTYHVFLLFGMKFIYVAYNTFVTSGCCPLLSVTILEDILYIFK